MPSTVGRASGRVGIDSVEPQFGQIERIDDHIDRTNGIALVDPVIEAVSATDARRRRGCHIHLYRRPSPVAIRKANEYSLRTWAFALADQMCIR